ncbi:type II toxin-antitoxin system VapC family toxin [Paraherbaspirillum soli]|uniref:Type II toxin-antitoxin system VapC family toxin n=1 Tax=Paraherbaspirillum soli TaxID=631222 RepID=A0ABW0MB34_9BURK
MILIDTSVWIDHLRHSDAELSRLLNSGLVLAHPFVTGELALGNLQKRDVILGTLQNLPQACVATDEEVMRFIDQNNLFGLGIGYIDAHLLAAVRLTPGSLLWTRDKRLCTASGRLGLSVNLTH